MLSMVLAKRNLMNSYICDYKYNMNNNKNKNNNENIIKNRTLCKIIILSNYKKKILKYNY